MKLSVLMLTYNQERSVGNTIRHILSQTACGELEVVMGDDASTDGTVAAAREAGAALGDRLRILTTPNNLGISANYVRAFDAGRGEYVALLDGEDFWPDPAKLERQIAALDADPNCNVVYTRAEVHTDAGGLPDIPSSAPERASLDDLLIENTIPACTSVFRRSAATPLPEWMGRMVTQDYATHLLCLRSGYALFLPVTTSVYRMHGHGVWSGRSRKAQLHQEIELFEAILPDLPEASRPVARYQLLQRHADLVRECLRDGDVSSAREHFSLAFPPGGPLPLRRRLKARLRLLRGAR